MTIAVATGRPLSVECGGLEPPVCDDAWRSWADQMEGQGLPGPVTWVVIEPVSGTCGTYTIGKWWPFDPFSLTAVPLC